MSILKKVLFLFLIGTILSLYSCSFFYGTCEDDPDIYNELISISKIQHIRTEGDVLTTSSISRRSYGGFRIEFDTRRTSYQKTRFSIFSSAYALDCSEADILLKNKYPVSIKIITINDLDENTRAGSIVNSRFILPFSTTNTEQTRFNKDNVRRKEFSIYTHEPVFYLDFRIRPSLTPFPEDIQFRIEMELNTGEIWIEETSIIETL